MGMLLGLALAVVMMVAAFVVSSASRRAERAEERAEALAARNIALERAVAVAQQTLRSLSNDSRLESGMAVEIDTALADVRRAAHGDALD